MAKGMSMKRISEEAGVSIATVSRVLNKQGNYSPEIEEKVMRVVEDSSYIPDIAARALRCSSLSFVGMIVADLTTPFFASLIFKLQKRLYSQGYVPILYNTADTEPGMARYLDSFFAYGVSSLIYVAAHPVTAEISTLQLPCVLIECAMPSAASDAQYVAIQADHVQAGFDVTNQLIQSGCTRILYMHSKHGLNRMSGKFIGYQHALWEHHIELDDSRILTLDYSAAAQAYETIAAQLQRGVEFDAVLANSDEAATGVIHALRDHGKSVPGDVKVFGYGNSDISTYYYPAISSVDLDLDGVVELAATSLDRLTKKEPLDQVEYTMPVKLVIRETT